MFLEPLELALFGEVWKNHPPMKINRVTVYPLKFIEHLGCVQAEGFERKDKNERAFGIIIIAHDEASS